MVAQAAIPIATAVGEFAAPYLIRKAGEIGLTRFIQVYGSAAATAIGLQKTQPVDLQTEKILGMPVSHITGQGEVYDDIDYSAIDEDREVEPLKYIDTVHGGKGPLEPIKAKPFPAETEVKKWDESFKAPEKIETTEGFEAPPQEKIVPPGFETPKTVDTSILTKDISKQTKDLVKEEPEFGALTEVEKQTALLEKGDKPDFYSRAIKSIEDAKPNKLTKTKWKSYIQSTKEELDYLGLTDFLKGNESITKQELLDFVKGKNIIPNIIVESVPKDQMNPIWKDYSLGGEQQEHIVFRINPEFYEEEGQMPTIDSIVYSEPHFQSKYRQNTFAHARTQVGFDADVSAKYDDLDSEVSELFDNTLIIDEIQSQWIQEGQNQGFKSEWKILKGDEITKEFLEKNYPGEYKIEKAPKPTSSIFRILAEAINQNGNPTGVWTEIQRAFTHRYYIFNKEGLYLGQNFTADSYEEAEAEIAKRAVPDLPLKDSKKFVELVLNEMIRKAVKDGRDSIAITNGQIQYNRYEAMGEEERQGLKKFYDTFVYDQLNKIAKNYGVELERIDISDTEQAEIDQTETQIQFPKKVKTAQTAGYKLEKIKLQELWDRVKDTNIPGHTALYSNQGRGQGLEYIENWINKLVDNREIPFSETTEEGLSGSGLKRWEKIKHNEVYIWKDLNYFTGVPGEDQIIWDMPIVPVSDTITNPVVKKLLDISQEERASILKSFTTGGAGSYPYEGDKINNIDLIKYTEYLRNYKPPEGVDLGYEQDVEQLIKMKLPKKLQKEILKKPIRLTKVEQQTDRMFG